MNIQRYIALSVSLTIQLPAHGQACSDSVINLDCCRTDSGLFIDGGWSCGSAPTTISSWGFAKTASIVLTVHQSASTGRLGFTDATNATIELLNSSLTINSNGDASGIINANVGANTALFGFSTETIDPSRLAVLNRGPTTRQLIINGDVVIGTLGGAAQLSLIGPNLGVDIAGTGEGVLVVGGTPSNETSFSVGSFGLVDIRGGALVHSGRGEIGSTVLQSTGIVELSGRGSKWVNTGTITLGLPNTPNVPSTGLLIVGNGTSVQSSLIVVNNGSIFGNGAIRSNISMQDDDAFINSGPVPGTSRLLSSPLTIDGSYTQTAGTFHIDLQFSSTRPPQDRLIVTGPIQLGGTFEVAIAPGFVPTLGDVYVPMVTSANQGISGAFDSLVLPQFADKRILVDVMRKKVTILVTVSGDASGDCTVDAIDIADILALWLTDDHKADLNQDGIVDGLDLQITISTFGQSCS